MKRLFCKNNIVFILSSPQTTVIHTIVILYSNIATCIYEMLLIIEYIILLYVCLTNTKYKVLSIRGFVYYTNRKNKNKRYNTIQIIFSKLNTENIYFLFSMNFEAILFEY